MAINFTDAPNASDDMIARFVAEPFDALVPRPDEEQRAYNAITKTVDGVYDVFDVVPLEGVFEEGKATEAVSRDGVRLAIDATLDVVGEISLTTRDYVRVRTTIFRIVHIAASHYAGRESQRLFLTNTRAEFPHA